ncbi:MAG: 16S rRNA (uracil(1498)-N(3))-methyltransferase [Burkholderiales bacterium]|mgnify:CR=1 FL=1|nr:16S rRNA (uracil(1498)-N(3))-methyltransferase [Burkholderiales bacterium]
MRIPRFYFPDPLALGARVALPPDAAHHAVRVLRLGENDLVRLFNGDGCEYRARIVRLDKQAVVALIESGAPLSCESPLNVLLVQGISSGERMDYTLQKSVELGVGMIQPIQAERSVVKLSGERMLKRMQHWQSVVASACEQSGRNVVPEVRPVSGLMNWLGEQASGVGGQASGGELRIHLAPDAELSLRDLEKPAGRVILGAGPEGGFSDNEHLALRQGGFVAVKLGPRVLRTETAALAALAALQILWGDY